MKTPHRQTNIFLYIALTGAILVILILVAIVIFFDYSATDRIYDLIILLTGASALILAIIASIDTRRQRFATEKIQTEIHDALKEIRTINKENDRIIRGVRESNRLGREVIKEVGEIEKLEKREIKEVEAIEKLEKQEIQAINSQK